LLDNADARDALPGMGILAERGSIGGGSMRVRRPSIGLGAGGIGGGKPGEPPAMALSPPSGPSPPPHAPPGSDPRSSRALSDKLLVAAVAGAMWAMAEGNTENQTTIANSGGIPSLIALLRGDPEVHRDAAGAVEIALYIVLSASLTLDGGHSSQQVRFGRSPPTHRTSCS
jgi:hypothetical protein